jgi:hypothetical protein
MTQPGGTGCSATSTCGRRRPCPGRGQPATRQQQQQRQSAFSKGTAVAAKMSEWSSHACRGWGRTATPQHNSSRPCEMVVACKTQASRCGSSSTQRRHDAFTQQPRCMHCPCVSCNSSHTHRLPHDSSARMFSTRHPCSSNTAARTCDTPTRLCKHTRANCVETQWQAAAPYLVLPLC